MKKKDASFWSDIKALDERLTREPDSFCFARLSEIYLKVGLVADALHTARTGVAKHPGYLAGQRALGMACNVSGLHDESRATLEMVTAAMPEDVDAQKVLAGLYVSFGDQAAAIRTYRTVLDFRPDDKGSALELETLLHGSTASSEVCSGTAQIDLEAEVIREEKVDDDIIELTESDIFEEPAEEETVLAAPPLAGGNAPEHHDPLSTLTLAELYEKQGFLPKALAIYRTILADDPANLQLLAKVAQLEIHEPVLESISEEALEDDLEDETYFSEAVASQDVQPPQELQFYETNSEITAAVMEPEFSVPETSEELTAPLESVAFAPLAHKSADNVVSTLDGWLENIRRIKACR